MRWARQTLFQIEVPVSEADAEAVAERVRSALANTLADLESLNTSIRALVGSAGDAGDDATVNLIEPFADEQEKTAWMLKAFLG